MLSVRFLAPEILLAAMAVAILVGGAFACRPRVWAPLAVLGLVGAGCVLLLDRACGPADAGLIGDGLGRVARWLALGGGLLLVPLVPRGNAGPCKAEAVGALLLAVCGVMLVASAGDLVLMFVGLELVSIPTYLLLYLGRRDAANQEATAKYFFLGLFASGMLLYGFSFLYGVSGSTRLDVLGASIDPRGAAAGMVPMAKIALGLVVAGLALKIAAVPFHFYAPDVYQGTTHAGAAVLSVVPKVAGFVAMVRVLGVGLAGLGDPVWQVIAALAVLTMTVGNVTALWQDHPRRLLAYSSIAHAGYVLIALGALIAAGSSGPLNGLTALAVYLVVYVVATIGVFAVLDCLQRDGRPIERLDDLAGLGRSAGWRRPMLGWLAAIFLFSLAGIPPAAGFWGKFYVFGSALRVRGVGGSTSGWFTLLAVVGMINAAVACAYYLRVVGIMFFGKPDVEKPIEVVPSAGVMAAAVASGVLVLGIGLGGIPLGSVVGAIDLREESVAQTPVAELARVQTEFR